jgi:hypothetical protein
MWAVFSFEAEKTRAATGELYLLLTPLKLAKIAFHALKYITLGYKNRALGCRGTAASLILPLLCSMELRAPRR